MSFAALLSKDLRRELRSKEAVQAGLVLVLLFVIIDIFSFTTLPDATRTAAALVWTPLVFAAAALVGRGFASEADRGTLDLLRSLPVSLGLHGWARTILHLWLLVILAACTAGAVGLLYAVPVGLSLAPSLLLGAAGLALVGTLAAGLAAQARAREALVPILMVPVLAPLVQAGLAATRDAFAGNAAATPLLVMLGYDLVAAGLAWLLWPMVLEGD